MYLNFLLLPSQRNLHTRKSASDSRGALPQSGTAEIIPVEPVRVMPAKGEVNLHCHGYFNSPREFDAGRKTNRLCKSSLQAR